MQHDVNMNVKPASVISLEFQRYASQLYGVVQCLTGSYGIWWLPYERFVHLL
jgi:hypothetical protein